MISLFRHSLFPTTDNLGQATLLVWHRAAQIMIIDVRALNIGSYLRRAGALSQEKL